MTGYRKKRKAIFMLLFFLTAFISLSGCSSVIDHTGNSSYEIMKLKNGYLLNGCSKVIVKNGVLYAVDNYLEESNHGERLISYQLDGYEIKKESLEVLLEDCTIIDFVVSENNDIYALTLLGQKYIFYTKLDDVEKLYEDFPIEYRSDIRAIFNMQVDKNGNYYFGAGNRLYVMDQDLNEISNLEESTEGLVVLKNGRVACIIHSDANYLVKEIDEETFQPLKEKKLKLTGTYTGNFKSGIDYDFNYEDDNCLYGYDFENGKAHLLFRLKKKAKTAASQIYPFGEQQYMMSTYSDDGEKATVIITIKEGEH
ncbi:MAG: hypothetical protein HDR01_01855 [Lachnospiraceae bacterium]|nr:hypothetical protein [Lachnospiraceae bacterium]